MHDAQAPANGPQPALASAKTKKSKNKRSADQSETEKLLAAKINQLELDAAGEKDQEQVIGMQSRSHIFTRPRRTLQDTS